MLELSCSNLVVSVPLKQEGIAAWCNLGDPICFHYLLSQHKDHKLFALTFSSEATQGPSPPSKADLPTNMQNLTWCVELLWLIPQRRKWCGNGSGWLGRHLSFLTSKPLFTHHGSQEDTLQQLVLFSSWNLTSSEYLFIWLRRQRSGNGPGFRSSNIEHRCALHCIACVIRLGTDSAVMKEQSGGGSANVQLMVLFAAIMSSQSCTSCYAKHINLVGRGLIELMGPEAIKYT